VRGTKTQLDQVRALVEGLDKPDGTPAPTAEPQSTEVFNLKYANPDEVRQALSAVLPGDNVRVEKRTGNLIITATKSELAAARSLIERLDQGVAQIYLEARLEEITDDGLQEMGVAWPTDLTGTKGEESGSLSSLVIEDWQVRLRAMEQSGKANLLANPKVLAVDGQEATIHIGDSIPIEVYDYQDGQRVGKIQFIEAGIILKVTPKINGAGIITAKITPEVSTIMRTNTTNGYPEIRRRQAETVLRMTDGQTVAIGGLRMEQEVRSKDGVPFLGSIPLLGKLFAVDRVDKKTSELVIFITARVVKEGENPPLASVIPSLAPTSTSK
jgi:type II secretory pathway component GspD/PulD (secretin)